MVIKINVKIVLIIEKKKYCDAIKNEINKHEQEYYDINKNKFCNTCNQSKCVTEFNKDKTKHDGYHSQCKKCQRNNNKKYYNENKHKINQNQQ